MQVDEPCCLFRPLCSAAGVACGAGIARSAGSADYCPGPCSAKYNPSAAGPAWRACRPRYELLARLLQACAVVAGLVDGSRPVIQAHAQTTTSFCCI